MFASLTLVAASDGGGSSAFSLVFFLAIGLLMYFMIIRPQKRRMREAQQLTASIGEGDEIITTGGIYGFVSASEGDTLWLDIADDVVIRVHRSAVARKVTAAESTMPTVPDNLESITSAESADDVPETPDTAAPEASDPDSPTTKD